MPQLYESLGVSEGSNADANASALATITLDQVCSFTKYVKKVLPIDGFVFWMSAERVEVACSASYASAHEQREDETITVNQIVLITKEEVWALNAPDPRTMWVGEIDGLKFNFTQRQEHASYSGLFNYLGQALYPALETQLVDSRVGFDQETAVVSNSLPAWLALLDYAPEYLAPLNPGIVLYPSFAVPDNLPPPYGVVHIEPNGTRTLTSAPRLYPATSSHYQLVSDRVRVTLYGCRNSAALDFVDLVYQYSCYTDAIGLMNSPVVSDAKRPQAEFGVLAQKKTIEFEISYYQTRMNDLAAQLIVDAPVTLIPADSIEGA